MSIWPTPMTSAEETLSGLFIDDETLRRWQESLDALEHGANAALGAAATRPTPHEGVDVEVWEPPAGLGPMPDIVVERARALAALQQRAEARLLTARAGVEREMAELTRLPRQVQPVYVDVTG